ncbi:TMEM175 family protein [Yinghuangia sp. YIM S10712]|uniref:TMEM175 family protein n=1 Tax=Yinghuangia sp. YIM S10712 TaxID=3436930 RepID=UPI003F53B8DB
MAQQTGHGDQHRPDRLVALSDGVFAIAMTLLVLDISVPQGLDSAAYGEELGDLPPKLYAYALSFLIIGIFWLDHGRVLRGLRSVDRPLVAVTLLGLGLVALLPFPTSLISEYADEPASVAFYAANIAAMDLTQIGILVVRARRPWLNADPMPPALVGATVADLAASVVVFAASIPLAWLWGANAMLAWLLLVPLKTMTGRRRSAAVREAEADAADPAEPR